MPVDLSYVPPAEPVPKYHTPVMVWVILFVLVVGGGALLMLSQWPKGTPTQTGWFWFCVAFVPFSAWLMLFCLYKMVHKSERVTLTNGQVVRDAYVAHEHALAQQPLTVLAVAHRCRMDDARNAVAAMAAGMSETGTNPAGAEPDAAGVRWLDLPDYPALPGNLRDEINRQERITSWLFEDLLRQCLPALLQLSPATPVVVRLHVAAELDAQELEHRWNMAWTARLPGRMVQVEVLPALPPLMAADDALDDKPGALALAGVTLLCVVQLQPVISGKPPESSTEAGVMLLLAPPAFVSPATSSAAALNRPVAGPAAKAPQTLADALLWGSAAPADVGEQWLGKLAEPEADALLNAGNASGLAVNSTPKLAGQHSVLQSVGDAGAAAHWLTAALALQHAMATARPQLVSVQQDDQLILAVARPA